MALSEVALGGTVIYRVEQVFLIHRESGLLLQHVSALDDQPDPELVSGMLTAIRDFAAAVFCIGTQSLDAIRLGEFGVHIEQGPHAILAAVVRGNLPPDGLRPFQDALEAIHREHEPELRHFDGDTTPFQRSRQVLETCLTSRLR